MRKLHQISDSGNFKVYFLNIKSHSHLITNIFLEEREHIQKKTFTKWVNSHLNRVQQKIEDLYKDCRDGRALLVLLEILSGEKLPKAARGRMRIHCLENNEKVLSFLRLKKVKLENLGPADITDGNHRLTLGLIWTIILRFQIQEIDFIDENKEKRSAKDALLLWCQMKTSDYQNVNVVNFTTSWKNGLAFNAIIHKHLPELINYNNLDANNAVENLENAFKVAEEECEIPALLDAEDVAVEYPDEKSIITYLAQYYHYFSKLKQQQLEGKRIGGVLDDIVITQQLQNQYESLASELLKWIKTKTADMNKRDFKNSLEGIQSQLKEYDEYRKVEKPPKMDERANLEILLFDIQTKLRAANRKAYTPKEGQMINDINSAWPELEDAEYNREKALREQLQKQELLARTAVKFETKAEIRSAWIYENKKLVQDDDFGNSLATVNASIIKQNTLDDEIQAYEDRMKKLPEILEFLSSNNYHLISNLKETNSTVFQKWDEFLALCQNRRDHLASLKDLHELLARCDEEELDLQEIKLGLDRDDYLVGMHLLECDDMIAKHNLVLKSLSTHEENITDIESHPKASDQLVAAKTENLKSLLDSIKAQANQRSVKLEESRALHKFNEDADDHETFLKLQQTALDNVDIGTDLNSVNNQINQFSEIEDDLTARSSLVEDTCKAGQKLVEDDHFAKDSILEKLDNLKENWANLKDKADFTKSQLDNQKDLYQTLNDAENLAKEIDDKVQTLNDLNITDPNSAVSAAGISNLANKLAQMKEDFNSNILGNKIPALKERISNCDNEMTYKALNEIDNGVEDFEMAAKQKYSELKLKKSALDFGLICDETIQSLAGKIADLENQNDNLDLNSVMATQKKLGKLDRDRDALKQRIKELEDQGTELSAKHPECVIEIQNKLNSLNNHLESLDNTINEKRTGLGVAVAHHYKELADLENWVSKSLRDLDDAEQPTTQQHALVLQNQHDSLKAEVDSYEPIIDRVCKTGREMVAGRPDEVAIRQFHTFL